MIVVQDATWRAAARHGCKPMVTGPKGASPSFSGEHGHRDALDENFRGPHRQPQELGMAVRHNHRKVTRWQGASSEGDGQDTLKLERGGRPLNR